MDEVNKFYSVGGTPVYVLLDYNEKLYGANYSRFAKHLKYTDFHDDDFKEIVDDFLQKYD